MASSYSQLVLADGAVGYWRLADLATTGAFDELQAHDGVYANSPSLGQPGAIRDGNGAVLLDAASTQYVEVVDTVDRPFSQPTYPGVDGGLTVECWVRPDLLAFSGEGSNDGHYVHWLGKGDTGAHEWAFRLYSSTTAGGRPGRISFYCFNPSGALGAGAYFQDPIVKGAWIYVVGLLDPGNGQNDPNNGVSIYKNGVFRNGPTTTPGAKYFNPTPPWTIFPEATASPVRFGREDGGSYFTGAIDEVAIYGKRLSAAQILNHYQVGVRTRASSRLGVSISVPGNLVLGTSGDALPTTGQLGTLGSTPGNLNLGRGRGTQPE